MSNDPVSKTSAVLPSPDLPGASPAASGGNTEKMLAALARMEDALRGDSGALDRVRADLAEMAAALAQAKTTLSANNPEAGDQLGSLLRTLEGRLSSIVDVVGAPPAAASASEEAAAERSEATPPPATSEPDRVPTVSNVVSRLGRAELDVTPFDFLDEPSKLGSGAAGDTPTVSMLGAMVEALARSIPDSAAKPGDETGTPAAPDVSAGATPAPSATSAPAADTRSAQPGERASSEVAAAPPAEPASSERSSSLMASFTRMLSIPYLQPDLGTAVIFQPKTDAPPASGSPEAAPLEQPAPENASESAPPKAEDANASIEAAFMEALAAIDASAHAVPQVDPSASTQGGPENEAEPAEPAAAAVDAPASAASPVRVTTSSVSAVTVREPSPPPVTTAENAPTGDEHGLFADADPDPAAFLLGPVPVPAVSQPMLGAHLTMLQAAVAAAPQAPSPAPAATVAPAAQAPAAAPPRQAKPIPKPAPYDPLGPLKMMSDEEKIALFS